MNPKSKALIGKKELAGKMGRKTPLHLKEKNIDFMSRGRKEGHDISSIKSKERKIHRSVGQDYKFH